MMQKSLRWRVAQFFEARWWKNYLADKEVGDYLFHKKKYWQFILERLNNILHMQPGQTVLDAGCGPSGVFIHLDQYKVTALDPLLDNYGATLPHFKRSMYPHVNFYNEALENFKSDHLFDVVFCMNAINHVSQLQRAFVTLHEHTKPGGRIIISIDTHNHRFFKYLFRLQPADILHPHQYDLAEYEEMLTANGGTIVYRELVKKEFFFSHNIIVAVKNA